MEAKTFPQRWWDLPAALLLMAAIITSGTRLVATGWTTNLSIVQTLVFFGLISGLALGYSRFSPRSAGFLALVYGAFVIPWQLGMTLSVSYSWTERMTILINRLQIILYALVHREPVRDSLLFLVIMFILYWVISAHAGYTLARYGEPWLAILPAGLAMFVIHSFDSAISNRIWYLAAYLFFGLIMVARMTFVHHHVEWQESRTALPPHISLDFIRYTILIAFVIVMLAWTAPALAQALPQANRAWQPVRTAWNRTIDHFENAFVSLKGTIFTYTSVYGSTTSLGRGSEQTDVQIFRAQVPADIPAGTRIYWRGRVYDYYQNGQWQSTFANAQTFDPKTEDFTVEQNIARWQGQFTIISASNISTLFTPEQPLWVSKPGQVQFSHNPDGTMDISMITASTSVEPGESYEVLAGLSDPTVQELQDAGTDYPSWIRERYMQIPNSITPRTKELAERITAGLTNPYDKAEAITDYLRKNIQYVMVLDQAPPPNQEAIDWFLFDKKKGFCNYYSTAEVILLRSLGIPARWAVGYAQGELLNPSASPSTTKELSYVIKQQDSHAWPEVYFPKIGWIQFEPTASQPVIQRLAGAGDASINETSLQEELAALREDKISQLALLREQANQNGAASDATNPIQLIGWSAGLLAGIALLVYSLRFLPLFGLPTAPAILQNIFIRAGIETPAPLKRWAGRPSKYQSSRIPAIPILVERGFARLGVQVPQFIQRLARQAELPILSKAYLEINRSLKRFGRPPAITDTPAERASTLGELLPPAEQPAKDLVSQYQIGTFSQQDVDLSLAQQSASLIRKLSIAAYFKRVLQHFQKPDGSRSLYPNKGSSRSNPER